MTPESRRYSFPCKEGLGIGLTAQVGIGANCGTIRGASHDLNLRPVELWLVTHWFGLIDKFDGNRVDMWSTNVSGDCHLRHTRRRRNLEVTTDVHESRVASVRRLCTPYGYVGCRALMNLMALWRRPQKLLASSPLLHRLALRPGCDSTS